MKKIISLLLFSCTFVILFFLLLADFEQGVSAYLQTTGGSWSYAGISFLLLLSDIILPVPSSLLMILNGKILGFFPGALLSLFSGLASSLLGFYLGRKANRLLQRFFSSKEIEAGNRLFARYGNLAVSLSKALPVLAEAVSFLAGTTSMSGKTFFLYSFIGQSVVAIVYAYIGRMTNAYDSNLVSAIIIVAALLMAWGVQAIAVRRRKVLQ